MVIFQLMNFGIKWISCYGFTRIILYFARSDGTIFYNCHSPDKHCFGRVLPEGHRPGISGDSGQHCDREQTLSGSRHRGRRR